MAGQKLKKLKIKNKRIKIFAIKEAVFPFNKFPEVDTILGPEMKSTGESMGIDKDFGIAFAKVRYQLVIHCLKRVVHLFL